LVSRRGKKKNKKVTPRSNERKERRRKINQNAKPAGASMVITLRIGKASSRKRLSLPCRPSYRLLDRIEGGYKKMCAKMLPRPDREEKMLKMVGSELLLYKESQGPNPRS
jgi:hypothetical protein